MTLVIAEPGCTHEGDYDALCRLVVTAHTCGADVWKPQWVSDPAAMCERRHIGIDHPQRAYYERAYTWLAFPVAWHTPFRAYCHAVGMRYACTVFLPQDVATLAPRVDYLKISSFEAEDQALVRAAMLAKPGHKPEHSGVFDANVIVSTGMMEQAIDYRVWDSGRCLTPAFVLHCTSSYPAPLASLNLSVLGDEYASRYGGLSDHSRHLLTGAVAVGCGARVIETHYRLDDCDPQNPDYPVAFTPAEFAQYIRHIRDAEMMLGDGIKQVQPCEAAMLPYRVVTSPVLP